MQRRLPAVLATAMLLFLVGCSETSTPTAIEDVPSATSQPQSLTEWIEMGMPEINSAANNINKQKTSHPQINDGHLAVFDDRSEWEDALPPLFRIITEDLENSNFPDNDVDTCEGPIEQRTGGNGCYPTRREILKIVNINNANDANGADGLAVITTGFLGATSTSVTPNFFADTAVLEFDKTGLKSVGFDLFDILGPADYNISVYDANGLIGSFVASDGFVGILTDEDITKVEVAGLFGFELEGIDNLTFNYERFGQNR